MGLGGPKKITFLDCRKRLAQPTAILCPLKYTENHLCEKGRLRSSQVICPVGVQDSPVIPDFIQEIVRHVLCKTNLAIAEKAHLYEIAIPSVHLIETASRHDIRLR